MAPAMSSKRRSMAVCMACFSAILLVVGCVAIFSFPFVVERAYNKEASLVNGSAVFDMWVSPSNDTPLYMNYYLFNITNPDDVILKGAKPILNQTGVIVYKQIQNKYNVSFGNDSAVVSYLNNHTYIYDPEKSQLKEEDLITTANFFFWTVLNSIQDNELIMLMLTPALNIKFEDEKTRNAVSPFYTTTVRNILWGSDGNEFLEVLKSIVDVPTHVGLQINGSNDGNHSISTGLKSDNEDRGEHTAWNGNTTLSYWNTLDCNMINGTDGTIFPTFMQNTPRLYIFSPNLCRSAFMTKEADEELEGVSTLKYNVPKEVFNVSFEENKGFCTEDGPCTNGLLDASACYTDQVLSIFPPDALVPLKLSVIISSPHFLYADNSTIHSVRGLNPVQTEHETYINVHMDTGVVVKAAKRLQFNTILSQNKATDKLDCLKNLTKHWSQLMPIFWAEEVLLADEDILDKVKSEFMMPQTVVSYASYSAIAIGIFLLLVSLSIFICCPKPLQHLFVDLDTDNPIGGERDILIGRSSSVKSGQSQPEDTGSES
ncbi:lysosome membrane protein 2-like [Symsagittifera roscoffensis]|uniref:lysosome membrane protein 2-like n=1 Tax=Symsagittifera roscoffensis TaxID=84072 RepID=UPI00307BB61E